MLPEGNGEAKVVVTGVRPFSRGASGIHGGDLKIVINDSRSFATKMRDFEALVAGRPTNRPITGLTNGENGGPKQLDLRQFWTYHVKDEKQGLAPKAGSWLRKMITDNENHERDQGFFAVHQGNDGNGGNHDQELIVHVPRHFITAKLSDLCESLNVRLGSGNRMDTTKIPGLRKEEGGTFVLDLQTFLRQEPSARKRRTFVLVLNQFLPEYLRMQVPVD